VLRISRPIAAYWTFSLVPQKCIDEKTHLLFQGIINIVSDFFVVMIPIPIVLKLKLPLRQRIFVALLFGCGFVVCFAGIVRTYYFYRLTDGYHDITWDAFPVWISSAIELYIGIVRLFHSKNLSFALTLLLTINQICTSAPPTKPFFIRYVPKLLTATSQYLTTNRTQSETLTSGKDFALKHVHTNSFDSREGAKGAEMEDEEIPEWPLQKKNSEIHKTVEISQSWLEVSNSGPSSSRESVEKLVR
jgi:hypothetical protein